MNQSEMLEKINEASQNGVRIGMEHAQPSPKTIKLIESMQKEIKQLPHIAESLKTLNNHFGKDGVICEIKRNGEIMNVRVLKLETWRAYLLGGWVVLTSVTTVLLPILFFLFMDNFRYEIKDSIDKQVSTAIEENNNKYFEEVE